MTEPLQNALSIAPSEERFLRNLAVLAEIAPGFHQSMLAFDAPQGKIVPHPGDKSDINLEFDGQLLYPGPIGARGVARAQVESYVSAPARLTVMPPARNGLTQDVTDPIRAQVEAFVASLGPAPATPAINSAGTLIVFGMGLGFHIDLLFERIQFRHLVLIEPFAELFWHSLWLHDWASWFERLAERGGSIHLMTGDDASAIGRELKVHLNAHCYDTLHGSYLYRHYDSIPLDECREQVAQEFQSLYFGSQGFFEDQIIMLVSGLRNIRRGSDRLVVNQRLSAQPLPAIIVGAGPSLEKLIPELARLRDQAIIFCAGSTLGTLMRHGITPDFQCEIENMPENYESTARVAARHDLTTINLLGSLTVDPRMPELFGENFFYVRDEMVTTDIFGDDHRTIMDTSPNCLTLAIRMAVEFGFKEIFLFGADFGSRQPDQHHVSDSIWMTDPAWRSRYNETTDPLNIAKPANFGGKCYTNRLLHDFMRSAERLVQLFGDIKFINCSDGLRVTGAISRLARQVNPKPVSNTRQEVLATIRAATLTTAGLIDTSLINACRSGYVDWTTGLLDNLDRWRVDGGDLIEWHDRLRSALDAADSFTAALARGSLMTMFQYAFFHAINRHLTSDPLFLDLVAECFREALRSMREVLDDVVDTELVGLPTGQS